MKLTHGPGITRMTTSLVSATKARVQKRPVVLAYPIPHTIEGGLLYPKARIVHINAEPVVLMGNDRVADCYVQGDAKVTLHAIDDDLTQPSVFKENYGEDA